MIERLVAPFSPTALFCSPCSPAPLPQFAAEPHKVFGFENFGSESARGLIGLKQGERRVADYSIDFRTRASQSSWNSSALCDAFLHGLAAYIKDELVSHDTPITLDGVIDLAIRIDLRIQTRRREQRGGPTLFSTSLPWGQCSQLHLTASAG